jgi:hypothetical protein
VYGSVANGLSENPADSELASDLDLTLIIMTDSVPIDTLLLFSHRDILTKVRSGLKSSGLLNGKVAAPFAMSAGYLL